MPSDLTPEEREAALRLIRQWTAAIGSGSDDADRALDALLANGWTPPAQPDAIAAAEARGRREGVEAAAKVCDEIARVEAEKQNAAFEHGNDREGYRAHAVHCTADTLAARIRALSSIPPQEADPT